MDYTFRSCAAFILPSSVPPAKGERSRARGDESATVGTGGAAVALITRSQDLTAVASWRPDTAARPAPPPSGPSPGAPSPPAGPCLSLPRDSAPSRRDTPARARRRRPGPSSKARAPRPSATSGPGGTLRPPRQESARTARRFPPTPPSRGKTPAPPAPRPWARPPALAPGGRKGLVPADDFVEGRRVLVLDLEGVLQFSLGDPVLLRDLAAPCRSRLAPALGPRQLRGRGVLGAIGPPRGAAPAGPAPLPARSWRDRATSSL